MNLKTTLKHENAVDLVQTGVFIVQLSDTIICADFVRSGQVLKDQILARQLFGFHKHPEAPD